MFRFRQNREFLNPESEWWTNHGQEKRPREMFRKGEDRALKDYLRIFGPAAFFTIIGFIVAYQFVQPAPPKRVVIATGMEEGAYYAYGKRYSEILARDGITLEVLSTAGSVENIKLLEAETGGVDVAFLQGGTGSLATSEELVSLGSLYLEPLWFFCRTHLSVDQISDLKGKRIAVGGKGSGTRVLSMQLLELNGLTSAPNLLVSEGGNKAAKMLLEGRVDAAFFVTSHRSSVVKMLLESKKVRLMNLDRVEAYTTRYRFLKEVRLPEGVIDFERNIPSRDITLLAPAAQLVAREDFHPALIDLLLEAAQGIHGVGGLFEEYDEFPSTKYLDFPLNKEARRFYESGPPFLKRHLPFWAATLVDRLKIMLLPLIILLLPFFKLMPAIYRWRVRSRIYRWYSELEGVDPRIQKDDSGGRVEEYLAELDRIEDKVTKVSIPLSYSEELYDLRLHIEMLRNELRKQGEKNTLLEEKEQP
jgi:TRAP transporter TAXI family solute receptor